MTSIAPVQPAPGISAAPSSSNRASERARALATRLEEGAHALEMLASALTDVEWQTRIPHDGRSIGVVVHHVASVYPLEVELALTLAGGRPLTGVTMADVHALNARHASEYADVGKDAAVELLRHNSAAAAAAIRALSDAELDSAAPASLYANAPVTCQFVLEDHAVRHSYHHLAAIERTLGPRP